MWSDTKIVSNKAPWLNELEEKLQGKVQSDKVTKQLYSTAACIFEIVPLAVVIPKNIEDIKTAINICNKYKIPILPRGAGSSLSGNSVGEAVILDLTHHFKEINIINDELVRSGVSVVLNNLQAELKQHNRKFAPDPSSGNVCVIGGMLGNNSGGPHTLKHGNMYRHVEEINVILSNGKIFNARNILLNEIATLDDFHRPYYEKVKLLLEEYSEKINFSRPHTTKSASGYQVWDILTETHLNMASLFVGSEGTLGVFTEAVLKTIPIVKRRGMISLYFTDLEKMGIAVSHLRSLGASAIEYVDQSFLHLALTFRPELQKFLPGHVKFLLYVEFENDDEASIGKVLQECEKIICLDEKLAELGSYSVNEEEIENIFRVRKAATVILNKIEGKEKPLPFAEDCAIHPSLFPKFLVDVSKIMDDYPFRYAMFGHAGDGNLHIRPLLNLKDEKSFANAEDFMEKFVDLVIKYNGTMTAEHGDGRLRTPYMEKIFPKLIQLFKEIKNLFDPAGIMNPDILVPLKNYKWNENLRYTPEYSYVEISQRMNSENWRAEIEKCHGCGTCREYCPVFQATGEEEATARSKANILRGIISGKISTSEINSDHFYKIMNNCLNCGQCLTDCPTGVNIPGIAVLAKEKLHEERAFKLNEIILQRGKTVSGLASLVPKLSNKSLSYSSVRKIMDVTLGIHSKRNFPNFARAEKRLQSNTQSKRVVLWTGCAAQFNDPDGELESSIQILNKLGFEIISPEWECCNIAKLSYGNFKDCQKDIDFNIKTLLPYCDQNIPIVFTAASCGYAFMHEHKIFFPENNYIKKIAERSYDIHEFLGEIFAEGEYKNSFAPINERIVYHAPCHLKTQKNKYGPTDLLKMIPGLELVKIKDSCCGIAGTFGMKKENFELSMAIGSTLFSEIKKTKVDYALSGCGTCQIQIKQGTGLEVIHPIVLINQSFQH
ncbi:MAG: anaerobic glycerol-3-phosphate dehydrogenase subunit C [Ignavibacteriales bacterium]|nr:anaerobic glycerol-3-phosphate dehydrogenase subunit C [Ignavibacteriales bacterium]